MKVLLLRPDKAGDALKTLPALRALKNQAPHLELHVLCSNHNASLFAFEPKISSYVLPKNWESKNSEELKKILEELKLSPMDTAINLLCDPFPCVDKLYELIDAKKKRKVQLLHGPMHREESLNIADIISQSLEIDILSSTLNADRAPKISAADEEEANAQLTNKQKRWIGVCPFAGTENRTHPLKRWQKFMRKTTSSATNTQFFLFGSPADKDALLKLKEVASPSSFVEILFPSSFRSLGAYLRKMDGIIAVDSGPLHYALALGVPSLGFLSGGDEKRWFGRSSSKDKLVPRGLLNRYPSGIEMQMAYKRWIRQTFS